MPSRNGSKLKLYTPPSAAYPPSLYIENYSSTLGALLSTTNFIYDPVTKDTAQLLTALDTLLTQHGPDSSEVAAFVKDHGDNQQFRWLVKIHCDRERERRKQEPPPKEGSP